MVDVCITYGSNLQLNCPKKKPKKKQKQKKNNFNNKKGDKTFKQSSQRL